MRGQAVKGYQQDQRYCEHCETETMQTFHSVDNSFLPEWQCHACGKVVRSTIDEETS